MNELNIKKIELEQQIEALEESKKVLEAKHKSQVTVFDNLMAKISDLSAGITALEEETAKKQKELSNLNDTIQSKTVKRSEIAKEIAFLEKTIVSMNKNVSSLKIEIQDLERLLKEESEKYEAEKKRLFNIGEREKTLEQQTDYIKKKYEEAGIAF